MNDYMKPKSITVGYNANPKDIEKIKQICNKNDISFYKKRGEKRNECYNKFSCL